MTDDDYCFIQAFLNDSCGIVLGDNKQYLVKNRLSNLLLKYDFSSFSELTDGIQSINSRNHKLKTEVIDAMTTNETFWFRDDSQFIDLEDKILPEIFEKKAGTIKLWSAACSSGQEPYTLSICAESANKKAGKHRNVQIIGTDVSESILAEAKAGVYSELALSRGLSPESKTFYFQKHHGGYKINEQIARNVRFQQFNLLKPFSVLGRFDVIFCRNVLIYFSDKVKIDILNRMANSLEPGGYIFLSSTEAMPASIKEFELIRGTARYFKKVF